MLRYIVLGAEAGFLIWMGFFLIDIPVHFMMEAENTRIAAIGMWADATTEPLEAIMNIPLEVALYCVKGLGFSEGFAEWLGGFLMFAIPATTGAPVGVALYGLTRLVKRRRVPPRSDARPADIDPASIPRPVDD